MVALAQQSNSIDEVIHGEALLVLRTLPDNSVDAIVCDPPAGIEFMGKEWDRYKQGNLKSYKKQPGGKIGANAGGGADFSARMAAMPNVANQRANTKCINCNGFRWGHEPGHPKGGFKCVCDNPQFPVDHSTRETFIAFITEIMAEALRVLKPGGHAFVWALPRTSHWTGIALEDAGWEVREKCYHIFGSGFPKSKNLGNGLGTALKPAVEEWILVRKPLSEKSIAANVLKWGVGAINIDETRVNGIPPSVPQPMFNSPTGSVYQMKTGQGRNGNMSQSTQGRWPANLLLSHSVWCVPNGVKKVRANGGEKEERIPKKSGNTYAIGDLRSDVTYRDSEGMEQVEDWLCDESCPVRLLDEQSGNRSMGHIPRTAKNGGIWGNGKHPVLSDESNNAYNDQGGASRYFQRFSPFIYQAKASRAERNRGCEGLPEQANRINAPRSSEGEKFSPSANHHPCVKPINLVRYLVRMITPPGGIVLDCFAGSGSTLVAAIHEGMHFIGIEQLDTPEEPYITIARARIEQAFREVQ